MRIRLRWAVAIVAVLALSGAVAAIAFAATSAPTPPRDPGDPLPAAEVPPRDVTPPTVMPAKLADAFAVFRAPARTQDALDPELTLKERRTGVNPDFARIVASSPTPAGRHYVAPGPADDLCTFNGLGSGGCQDIQDAIDNGIVGTDECAPNIGEDKLALSGIVRDGVDTVQFTLPNGTTTDVPVEDNGWTFIVGRARDERPTSLQWTFDGTTHTSRIPYSPDVDKPC